MNPNAPANAHIRTVLQHVRQAFGSNKLILVVRYAAESLVSIVVRNLWNLCVTATAVFGAGMPSRTSQIRCGRIERFFQADRHRDRQVGFVLRRSAAKPVPSTTTGLRNARLSDLPADRRSNCANFLHELRELIRVERLHAVR